MSSESAKRQQTGTRITVTVPPDHYAQVCRMAKGKKVSNAWIIRDAVEKYIQADTPLFAVKEARYQESDHFAGISKLVDLGFGSQPTGEQP